MFSARPKRVNLAFRLLLLMYRARYLLLLYIFYCCCQIRLTSTRYSLTRVRSRAGMIFWLSDAFLQPQAFSHQVLLLAYFFCCCIHSISRRCTVNALIFFSCSRASNIFFLCCVELWLCVHQRWSWSARRGYGRGPLFVGMVVVG